MHADGAVTAIVIDDHDDGQAVLQGGGEFLPRHQEVAVTRQHEDGALRIQTLDRHGGGQAEAHKAADRRHLGGETAEAIEAVNPGGVIACAVGQCGVGGQMAAQPDHDLAEIHRAGLRRRPFRPIQIVLPRCAHIAVVRMRCQCRQRGCEGARAGVNAQMRAPHPADLFALRIQMHRLHLRLGQVEQRIALLGQLIGPPARDNHQIAGLKARHQLGIGAKAQIAGIVGVGGVEQMRPAKSGGDGNAEILRKCLDRIAGRLIPARPAQQQHGTLRLCQQGLQCFQLLAAGGNLRRFDINAIGGVGGHGQHIVRQRQHHGAGPSVHRFGKGAADMIGHGIWIVDLGSELGHAAEHGFEIQFLKRAAAPVVRLHLSGKQDQGRGILLGDMDAARSIGGAGPARDETDAGAARRLAMGFGHHRRAAFVAADDDINAAVLQRIQHRQIGFTRHAEDAGHALDAQLLDQNLRGGAARSVRGHATFPLEPAHDSAALSQIETCAGSGTAPMVC